MAYTPSANDIPSQNAGYQPSLDDIPTQTISTPKQANIKKNISLNDVIPGFNNEAEFKKNLTQAGSTAAMMYNPEFGLLAKAAPWLKNLGSIGKSGLITGLASGAQNPEDKTGATLGGATTGAGTQAIVNALSSRFPWIRAAARAAMTAGGGYLGEKYGGSAGAIAGGTIGALAPTELMGLIPKVRRNAISDEALEGLTKDDVSNAVEANRRLGTPITPAQASGNYVTGGNEGQLKRTPQGAQVGYELEEQQKEAQSNAINKMLDNIYKPTAENKQIESDLYAKANRTSIKPDVLKLMRQNPVIDSAFKTVGSVPAFKNVPETNYAYLAEVDRQLQRDLEAAEGNKPNQAYAISQVKQAFNKTLKNINPDYAAATQAAQPRMIRESMERRFNKNAEDYTGKNFYNKFLNTKASTEDILKQTQKFPEAQQAIKDMRAGWKHLSNIKTVSQGEAQAKTGISDFRDHAKMIMNYIKKATGAKNDIEGLRYIYSNDWEKDLDRIAKIPDIRERNRKLLTLFGRAADAYGLSQ